MLNDLYLYFQDELLIRSDNKQYHHLKIQLMGSQLELTSLPIEEASDDLNSLYEFSVNILFWNLIY
jgi:hypothetical protein